MSNYPFGPKKLDELTFIEWESLCDGCGKCCLVKIQNVEQRETVFTNIACRLLDISKCQCTNYGPRRLEVSDCRRLTPKNVPKLHWLPDTCAYRLVHEQRPLPEWHHLICGNKQRVHELESSVPIIAVHESEVKDIKNHILKVVPFSKFRRRLGRLKKSSSQ